MTTTAITAPSPQARRRSPGLASAEFLKLRRRRGLVLSALALTVVPIIVAYVVLSILHATNPEKHGPAGGVENFVHTIDLLRTLGVVAAVLVGAIAGTSDLRAGVFRELVATGRSRLALFGARVPGGLALLVPLVLVSFATTAVASVALAGSLARPSTTLLLHSAGWVVLVTTLSYVLALGVSSVVGSTGPSIAILLGWQLVVAPQLLPISALGNFRDLLPGAAPLVLAPEGLGVSSVSLSMSYPAAAAAVVAWSALPLLAGAWRTKTRDA